MNCPGKEKKNKSINLNTAETAEYQQWVNLLKEICDIQSTLKKHPNQKGLKKARSKAYNVLADIQALIEAIDHND